MSKKNNLGEGTIAEISQVGGFLGWIERIGNKIPDITILFVSVK